MKKIHKIYGAIIGLLLMFVIGLFIFKTDKIKDSQAPSSSPPKASHKTSLA